MQQVIPAGGLDCYLQKVNSMTLYDFLTKHISDEEQENEIVQVVIKRIERHEAYKSASTTVTSVA